MSDWLATLLGVLGGLGVLFGIYKYAKLIFDVKELSDFGLPEFFYLTIQELPLSISVLSAGNKLAANILIHIKTNSEIKNVLVSTDEQWTVNRGPSEVTFRVANLNPKDAFHIIIYCAKPAIVTSRLQAEVKVTLSEGRVLDKRSVSGSETFREYFDKVLDSYPAGLTKVIGKLLIPWWW
jgi:hypothetical protein